MKRFMVVIIILVLAGIGFAGWKYFNKNKENTGSQQNTSQTIPDSSENGKYLVIKEWGVRLPLTEELRGDIYYHAYEQEGTVWFSSKRFASIEPYCAAEEFSLGRGIGLFRASEGNSKSNPDLFQPFATIEGFEFQFMPQRNFNCNKNGKLSSDQENDMAVIESKLIEAIKKLEKVPPQE